MTRPPHQDPLSNAQLASSYLELWKKAIEVQQHFNDLEFRVRGLALTVATFALGAAAVAGRDSVSVGPVSLGACVAILGLILWQAFYFMDRYWYHPLLKAAVAHAEELERSLEPLISQSGLTSAISAASPVIVSGPLRLLVPGKKQGQRLHSDDKIALFYRVGSLALLLAAIGLQCAVLFAPLSNAESASGSGADTGTSVDTRSVEV